MRELSTRPAPIAASAAASSRAPDGTVRGRSVASLQPRPAVLQGRGAWRDAGRSKPIAASASIGGDASWNTALDLVAARFRETIAAHGPDSVAFYVSGQLLTEDYYVANKLMKGFIGSGNIDTNSRLCMASSVAGHKPRVRRGHRARRATRIRGGRPRRAGRQQCRVVPSGAVSAADRRARPRAGTRIVVHRPAPHRDGRSRRPPSADRARRRRAAVQWSPRRISRKQARSIAAWIARHANGLEAALEVARARRARLDSVAATLRRRSRGAGALLRLVRRAPSASSPSIRRASTSRRRAPTRSTRSSTAICHRPHRPARHGAVLVTGQPNAMGGREVGGLANQLAAHMEFDGRATCDARAALLAGAEHRDAPGPEGGRAVRRGR